MQRHVTACMPGWATKVGPLASGFVLLASYFSPRCPQDCCCCPSPQTSQQAELEASNDVEMKRLREDSAEAGSSDAEDDEQLLAAAGNGQQPPGSFIGPALPPGVAGRALASAAGAEEQHDSFRERAKYIPLRLNMDERRLLRLLEAALSVSEYTGVLGALHCFFRASMSAQGRLQRPVASTAAAPPMYRCSTYRFPSRRPQLMACAVPPRFFTALVLICWRLRSFNLIYPPCP